MIPASSSEEEWKVEEGRKANKICVKELTTAMGNGTPLHWAPLQNHVNTTQNHSMGIGRLRCVSTNIHALIGGRVHLGA